MVLYADSRQVPIDKFFIEKYKLNPKVEVLETGDYIWVNEKGEKFIFELKTPSDFLGSIKSGRMWEQINRMVAQENSFPFVVITTDDLYEDLLATRTRYPESVFWGSALSIMTSWHIQFLILSKSAFFKNIIKKLENKKNKKSNPHLIITKYHKKTIDLAIASLTAIPQIGGSASEKLIKEFHSLKAIANASQEDLEKVLNKKQAENLYTFFNSRFY